MSFVLGLGSIRLLDAMVCAALDDAELPLHCEVFFRAVYLSLMWLLSLVAFSWPSS